MRRILVALTLVAAMLLPAFAVQARDWRDQPFDPATMSREDMATLQAALAFSGDYYGFLDGLWNDDAAKALADWTQRERGHATTSYRDLTDLILALEDERVENGWQLFHDSDADISYLFPYKLLLEEENDSAVEFLSADKGFSMIIRTDDYEDMQSVHDWFLNKAQPGSDPFRYNDDRRWITSATIDSDYIAYARSDRARNYWLTLSIVIEQKYFPQLNILAASVTPGGSPASLLWTAGGVIDRLINGSGDDGAPSLADASPNPKDQVIRPRPPGVEAPPEPPPGTPPADRSDSIEIAGITPGPAPGGTPPAGGLGTPAPGTGIAGADATPATAPASPAPGGGALGTAPPAAGGTVDDGQPDAPPAGLGTAPGKAPAGLPAATAPATGGEEATAPREKVRGKVQSSGSGFYIAPTVLVTAQHVVDGCRAVAMIDGTPLDVLAEDPSLDVAVLAGATDAGAWLKLSALEVPKLGETVTVLGYPYYTSLDQGLTVTSGNVSALRGADGSSNRVMISAPVQPGNSGGPLLNRKGAVIGVVVSRMDDLAVLQETGSLPQNMNFAVPSGPLLTFLAQNRITRPQGEGSGGEMSGGEVPEGVAKAVVPLYCYE